MEFLPICDNVTSLIDDLDTGSLSFADLLIVDTFQLKISKKFTFINNTTNLIRKVSKYWEVVKLMFENSLFILSNKYCQLFSMRCQAHLICFWENVYKMSTKVWIIIVCLSVVISIKYGVQWRMQLIQLPAQSQRCFSLKHLPYFSVKQKCFMGTPWAIPQGPGKPESLR